MMFKLLVKGSMADAKRAAAERGVRFVPKSFVAGDAVSGFAQADEDVIQTWYCEPGNPTTGKGFPVGTLLHYGYATKNY